MRRSSGGGPSWWVTDAGRPPIGPVSTELLLRGIAAGKVPREALVCAVGQKQWKPVRETPPFSDAFAQTLAPPAAEGTDLVRIEAASNDRRLDTQRPLSPFSDLADERTIVDVPSFDLPTVHDTLPPEDRTLVDGTLPLETDGSERPS